MQALYSMKSQPLAVREEQYLKPELFSEWIKYIDATPQTVRTYTRAIKQFVEWIDSKGITQPTRADILNYRDYLKEKHKPTTTQNYITALRLFFQWTELSGLYPNIAQRVKGARVDREHKKDCLTSGQVQIVLDSLPKYGLEGLRNYAMIALMFTCGLRTIEVSRANIEDIRTFGDSTVLYVQGKGHEEKSEFVKIPQQLESIIRHYLLVRHTAEPTEPLFISLSNNSKGKRLSTRTISGTVKKCFINAGFDSDRLTAHSTRHTAVTLSLTAGESLQDVQAFARHKNIATTLIYAHNIDKEKNNCTNAVANLIF